MENRPSTHAVQTPIDKYAKAVQEALEALTRVKNTQHVLLIDQGPPVFEENINDLTNRDWQIFAATSPPELNMQYQTNKLTALLAGYRDLDQTSFV